MEKAVYLSEFDKGLYAMDRRLGTSMYGTAQFEHYVPSTAVIYEK